MAEVTMLSIAFAMMVVILTMWKALVVIGKKAHTNGLCMQLTAHDWSKERCEGHA